MVAAFFEFDYGRASRMLALLPGAMLVEYERASKVSGNQFVEAAKARFAKRGSQSDDFLTNRTNTLRESIGAVVSGDGLEQLQLKVFSAGTKYANLQEFGGTITPKNSKWLAFPSDDPEVRTPAGVALYTAREFIEAHKGETFFLPGKNPNTLLLLWNVPKGAKTKRAGKGQKAPPKGEARVVFILKKSVTIPPRFGFRKTWESLASQRQGNFKRATDRAVAAAAAGANRA